MVKKPKHVHVRSDSQADRQSAASSRSSRLSFFDNYNSAIMTALEERKEYELKMENDGVTENFTPPLLEDIILPIKLQVLVNKIDFELPRASDDMEEIVPVASAGKGHDGTVKKVASEEVVPRVLPFIKIVLKRTPEVLLFESRSNTVSRDSDMATKIEEDNKFYEYITLGKGRIRRTVTSEAQTTDVLYKSRDSNTERMKKANVVSYVSNFEMFDTYRNLETTTKSLDVGDSQQINVTTYKVGGVDQFERICKTDPFKLKLMITLRMLAGNIYEKEQRRFRNMILPDPLCQDVMFTYNLVELFSLSNEDKTKTRLAVADIEFCPGNGDIIAIAYGVYLNMTRIPTVGYCYIWNIKNPVNPERIFQYDMPVVSVKFSPVTPQLLAIGLFDGSVEVLDIGKFDDPPIAVSLRLENSSCDPVAAIEWLPQSGESSAEIDPFLAFSLVGTVTKYRIINSPYLLAFQQMQLDRVEGSPEGIYVQRSWRRTLSSQCPLGINMILHPRQQDIYYLLTDEGCIHKCSTNYPHQHIEVLQVHDGGVTNMDFSPWSPKVYLTVGNDWFIRVWMEGIFEPLISMKNEKIPVQSAFWSKTHSTIIISNTRKGVSIWDLRRSSLKPVAFHECDSEVYTLLKISLCGRSIALGTERGTVIMMALEDFPFEPHFQYDELEHALHTAVSNNKPHLVNELKSIGFFGYPEHRRGKNTCV